MAEENKKLSEAVAAGQGAKHNIEVEETEEHSDEDGDDAMAGDSDKKDGKPPNFALGMMDEDGSDSEVADATDTEAQIKAATTAKVIEASSGSKQQQQQQEETSSFRMRVEKPSSKPRPVIQELN
ncbi:unnamed protein product [Phytophthora lilii]|uniref:Unnamed protein product n=1 Tax=Phytophthora lilii TaxID=2077276 RepID=A0A9W6TCJ8_9STRA|nr:unnamed protein product [Phytophthora lilii]